MGMLTYTASRVVLVCTIAPAADDRVPDSSMMVCRLIATMTEANPETTVKYGGGTADGISLEPHKRRCSSIRCTDCVGRVGDDDTVLVSGFGSVGYPKAGPSALAESDHACR